MAAHVLHYLLSRKKKEKEKESYENEDCKQIGNKTFIAETVMSKICRAQTPTLMSLSSNSNFD